VREPDSPRAALVPPPAAPAAERSETLPRAPAELGPGLLEAVWRRAVHCWQRAEALLAVWADWLTMRFLGALLRLRLVSAPEAAPALQGRASGPAASAYHLDLALRLLVVAVYLATLLLFALAGALTAYTRCADCWFIYLPQGYVVIPLVGVLCGLTRLRQPPARFGPEIKRASFALMAGLGASAIGLVVWLVYAALGESLPYPSLADACYVGQLLLWMLAIVFIYRSQKTTLVGELGPFAPIGSAVMAMTVTLVLFATRDLQLGPTTVMATVSMGKIVLDIAYPLLGVYNCAFMVPLLAGRVFDTLNADMKKGLICLALGMLFNLLADISFAVTTTIALKAPGSLQASAVGNVEDWIYATALMLVSVGVLFLNSDPADATGRAAEPR